MYSHSISLILPHQYTLCFCHLYVFIYLCLTPSCPQAIQSLSFQVIKFLFKSCLSHEMSRGMSAQSDF